MQSAHLIGPPKLCLLVGYSDNAAALCRPPLAGPLLEVYTRTSCALDQQTLWCASRLPQVHTVRPWTMAGRVAHTYQQVRPGAGHLCIS